MKKYIKSFEELVEINDNPEIVLHRLEHRIVDLRITCAVDTIRVEKAIKNKEYWYEKEEYENMSFDKICTVLSGNVWIRHKKVSDSCCENHYYVNLGSKKINGFNSDDFCKNMEYSTDLKKWHEFKKVVK